MNETDSIEATFPTRREGRSELTAHFASVQQEKVKKRAENGSRLIAT